MAVTPGWKTNAEGEEEYYDKGAVTTPQVNEEIAGRYMDGKNAADAADYVEWPTKIHGQESQGM